MHQETCALDGPVPPGLRANEVTILPATFTGAGDVEGGTRFLNPGWRGVSLANMEKLP